MKTPPKTSPKPRARATAPGSAAKASQPPASDVAPQRRPPGRPPHAKTVISEAKLKYLTLGGQTPLEFLTAVYRDQLYDEYEVEVIDEKKGIARVWPKLNPVTGELEAKKIPIELERRIAAATAAAPYVHRKRPIGIDGGEGKPLTFIGADQLAALDDASLNKLLEIMGRMGIGAEFQGADVRPPSLED